MIAPVATIVAVLAVPLWLMWPQIRPLPADPWESAALEAWRRDREQVNQ